MSKTQIQEKNSQNKKFTSTDYFLLGANFLTAGLIFYFNRDIIAIILVYWLETLVIGFYNYFKILALYDKEYKGLLVFRYIAKFFLGIVFLIHYNAMGILVGLSIFSLALMDSIEPLEMLQIFYDTWPALIPLLLSHGYSFYRNYIKRGERKRATMKSLMGQPYIRVFFLMLVIILGIYLNFFFSKAVFMLVIFIALKVFIDLLAHKMERRKFSFDLNISKRINKGMQNIIFSLLNNPIDNKKTE